MSAGTRGLTFFFILLHASLAAAQGRAPARPIDTAPWTFELAGGAFHEAWNYNLSDEDLATASFAWLRRIDRHWSAGLEALLMGVQQDTVPNTAVYGFSTLIRWQSGRAGRVYFGNVGGGYSFADEIVPARGTRANYVAQAGGGVLLPTGAATRLLLELSWLHLSNNGLNGIDHNPDIQALGLRVGMVVPLTR